MEKPNKDTPTASYLEHSAFTVAGIAADPDVAGLEAGLAAVHIELKAKTRELEDLAEEVQRKLAVFLGKDRSCDKILREFELRLLALVNKKRNDALYVRYFKDGLREVTEADPRKVEPQLVEEIIRSLSEDEAKPGIGPLAQEFKPQLETALAAVIQTEQALAGVEKQHAYLENKTIPEIEARWTDEYVKLHGSLKTPLPRDPARIESFFRPFKKRKGGTQEDGGSGPAEGEGTPGGEPPAGGGGG